MVTKEIFKNIVSIANSKPTNYISQSREVIIVDEVYIQSPSIPTYYTKKD